MAKKPFHQEEWIQRFLDHSQIQKPKGAFVLGCFERRRVTVGAQQVRAINLVEALLRKKIVKNSLIVIGAGAGGLTVAAYAAFRGVKEIHVVDENNGPLATFKNSSRLLHPRLYEWPFEKLWAKCEVDLPLMNWSAGPARDVAAKLLTDWNSWRKVYGIRFYRKCRLLRFKKSGAPIFKAEGTKQPPSSADAMVLAVGFGKESRPRKIQSPYYWQDDDLDKVSGDILICGNGDGALTDLFRARVRGFRQELLQEFLKSDQRMDAITKRALEIETKYERSMRHAKGDWKKELRAITQRAEQFESLTTNRMIQFIVDRLRDDTDVTQYVLKPKTVSREQWSQDGVKTFFRLAQHCFPLNRLFANALFSAEAKQTQPRLRFQFGKIKLPRNHGSYSRVIYRGGTDSRIRKLIPEPESNRLAQAVLHPETGDMTRFPLWEKLNATPAAMVPDWKQGKAVVAEIYARLPGFITYTDLLDSVTQAQLYDAVSADSPVSATDLFRGVLRLLTLLSDQLALVDAQLLDGPFFLKWNRELQQRESREELAIYRRKLRLKSRTGDFQAYKRFFFNADGTLKTFEPSAFPIQARKAFLSWIEKQSSRVWNDTNDLFQDFVQAHAELEADVNEVQEAWNSFHHKQPFPVQRWSGPWTLDEQFEDPGQFHASLSTRAKLLLGKIWIVRDNRTKVWGLLNNSRIDDPQWNAEVDLIRDWYNRAYNRAGARQHGSTVFTSLYGTEIPNAEPAGNERRSVDVSGLGKLSSDEFVRLAKNSRLQRELARWRKTGDVTHKLDIFQMLSEDAPARSKIKTKANSDVWTRRITECLRFVEIDQRWIGSRELGPHMACNAVCEQGYWSPGERNQGTEVMAKYQ